MTQHVPLPRSEPCGVPNHIPTPGRTAPWVVSGSRLLHADRPATEKAAPLQVVGPYARLGLKQFHRPGYPSTSQLTRENGKLGSRSDH